MLGGINGEEAAIRDWFSIASKCGLGHCLIALFACIVSRLFERPSVRYAGLSPFAFVLVRPILSSDLE